MNKRKIINLLTTAGFLVVYVVVVHIAGYPWYMGWLAVLAYTAVWAFFYRHTFLFYMGNIYQAGGNDEKSKAAFLRSIKMNTKDARTYLNYGVLLLREGSAKEALDYLKKAMSLKPEVIDQKNIMLTMGTCYWLLGEIDSGLEILEELRAKFDYVNHNVLTTLGYLYFLKGQYDKAIELSDEAIKDTPESFSAWDNKGQVYYRLKDYEKAKECFSKALEYKSDLVDSLYYMGVIAEEEKDEKTAREYFVRASKCRLTALNTVKNEEIQEKYRKYAD